MAFNRIKEDLYRHVGKNDFKSFLRTYFFVPGFRYMVWFRLGKKFPKNILIKLIHRKLSYKFGIQIPLSVRIGKGFYIGHYNCIVINSNANIGDNVNISHGITIGQINIGDKEGTPIIGNNVYIGPGAKILGNIIVGNNAVVGANAVVVKNVKNNSVIGGVPAVVISNKGSEGYINRTV